MIIGKAVRASQTCCRQGSFAPRETGHTPRSPNRSGHRPRKDPPGIQNAPAIASSSHQSRAPNARFRGPSQRRSVRSNVELIATVNPSAPNQYGQI
jgi:hypothetical protein